MVYSDLDHAGSLNLFKSQATPIQIINWLGFYIDQQQGCFYAPKYKITRLKKSLACQAVLLSVPWPVLLAEYFFEPCLGSKSLILFEDQGLYAVISQRIFWFDKLPLSVEATHEVVFWLHHIDQFDGQPIWFSPGISRVVYSDASSTGYGWYVVELGPDVCSKLKAVDQVLCSFA